MLPRLASFADFRICNSTHASSSTATATRLIMLPRCQSLSGRLSANGAAIRSVQSTPRTYATTSTDSTPAPIVKNPLQRRKGGDLGSHLPKHVIPKDAYIPTYPYGNHQLFKQANKGLYGEQSIQYGNNVSKKTETKTRRKWKPNVLSKSLFSVALKKKIKLRITAKVLKTMDREGGLDEYLLKDNEHRIKELGPMGWALRWTLMQKPEVISRLRTDAAALGIDQASIDKQWPTPEMMAQQRAALGASAREAQANSLENHAFTETEEQQMWDPENAETTESRPSTLFKAQRKVAAIAATEYISAVRAAQRYLSRGLVDSEEEGLKVAFVRAKERRQASLEIQQKFINKLDEGFTAEDVQETKTRLDLPNISDFTARKIAYNQRKRKQIDEAGGYDAWLAASAASKRAATYTNDAEAQEARVLAKKAEYAQLLAEAETAATNELLDPEKRSFLNEAINKADRAIQAKASGGQDIYVESALEEFLLSQSSSGNDLSGLLGEGSKASGDAWAALVNTNPRRG